MNCQCDKLPQLLRGDVSPRAQIGTYALENGLKLAIQNAIDAEVPQGFIVALLHAYALQQTQRMIEGWD